MNDMPISRTATLFFALCVAAVIAANGQVAPANAKRPSGAADSPGVQNAISKVKKGDFTPIDIAMIVMSHAVQAIPPLETQFERSRDPKAKARIADALVRLGETKGPYWDFVANHARQILKDAPPTPFDFDASGKMIPTKPSKKLVAWADRHHMPVQQAARDAMIEAPAPIIELGNYDDPRAIPVLRKALASENDFIQYAAARGLAELHDSASIPEIIRACQNAPEQVASQLAQSLVSFDDPAAQRAVDEYVPKRMAQELREARAHGMTPSH